MVVVVVVVGALVIFEACAFAAFGALLVLGDLRLARSGLS